MRLPIATIVVLGSVLAGCAGPQGTLNVMVTDAPDAIRDFSRLSVNVSSIEILGANGVQAYDPSSPSFDLTQLTNGNLTTLFKGQVPAGNYSKLELVLGKATGTLRAGGAVDVKAPKGSIFLPMHFTVAAGAQTDFVFDVHVVAQGNGGYMLAPNAGGSRVSQRSA